MICGSAIGSSMGLILGSKITLELSIGLGIWGGKSAFALKAGMPNRVMRPRLKSIFFIISIISNLIFYPSTRLSVSEEECQPIEVMVDF